MKIGYLRISDKTQNKNIQIDELMAYGVDRIVEETVNGDSKKKDKLDELVDQLTENDELVVLRHDRLGRNTLQLLTLIETLKNKKVKLNILSLKLDSESPFYEPLMAILSAFSDMDKKQLKEKQKLGIEAARRRGTHLGRKARYTKQALEEAMDRYETGKVTYADIEEIYNIPRTSLYLALKKRKNASILAK